MKATLHDTVSRNFSRSILLGILSFALLSFGCGGYDSGSYNPPPGGGGGTAPYITTQPVNQTVTAGQTATFTVAASGTAPLTYQWRKNGANIAGATASSYTTPATNTADSGETFDVVVSNSAGSATSNTATLTVNANTGNTSSWTYVQDSTITYCSSGTSCGAFSGTMIPTQSGTVWVFYIDTASATSASVSGGGATWTECVSCRITVTNHHAFVFYAFNGSSGQTDFSISAPGNSGSLSVQFAEIQPPAGSTASFDVGTGSSVSCGGTPATCVGPSLALSATDFVMNFLDGTAPGSWNGWPSPWLTLPSGDGALVNATGTVAAPTVTVRSGFSGNAVFSAIAFKSSLGSFTPPVAGPISIVQFTDPDPTNGLTGLNCAPSCSLSLPSATGSGHLLYLEAANVSGTFISTTTPPTGGGAWVAPASCQIKGGQSANNSLSCAYVLSSTSGATSISITMTGNANTQFAFYELSTSVGVFSFDVAGTATNAASLNPAGVSLPLASGGNDVIFHSISVFGGTSGLSYYPFVRGCSSGCGPQFYNGQAASDALLNVAGGTTPPIPQWVNQQNSATVVTGVAFSTPP